MNIVKFGWNSAISSHLTNFSGITQAVILLNNRSDTEISVCYIISVHSLCMQQFEVLYCARFCYQAVFNDVNRTFWLFNNDHTSVHVMISVEYILYWETVNFWHSTYVNECKTYAINNIACRKCLFHKYKYQMIGSHTVKPVHNDHITGYFSAFKRQNSKRQKLLARVN